MYHKRALLALLLLLCLPPFSAADDNNGKLSLDLYFEWETAGNPRISPDGSQIIYTRGWIDKVNDRRRSSIWIMNADGSKNRYLTDGSSPQWSLDGTRIAFTRRGEPRGTQIFVRWMDAEGATTQITHLDRSPGGLTWSPDGKSLSFSMLVPKPNRWNIKMPKRPRGAKWVETPRIIQRSTYRRDRVGFLEEGYRHIFVVSAEGGTPRQITSGDFNHGGGFRGGGISFTPDGKEIFFSGMRSDDWEYRWRESHIYAVNIATKNVRQVTDIKGPFGGPVVSPDGRWVAFTGNRWVRQTYFERRVWIAGVDGSTPRELTAELDRSPSGLRWAADSSGLYFTANDKGARNLHFVSRSGQIRQVTKGNHMLSISDINPNGQAVGTLTSYQKPRDVVSLTLDNPGNIRQLTFVNDDILQDVKLGEVEEIWYDSVDGLRIQGWIIKPPDFDPNKKYPLMLSIHGGPHGMYNVGFNFGWQNHAANGYVVLYTNPRGSSGFGTDFGNAINNAYPSQDYDDLMNGVDEVLTRGYIDDRNLFVYGCSGGGVLTAWVVGHTDRFAAASSNCPVINWISFVGNTDGNSWYKNFKKFPWEDPTEHLERSPLMYVGNVKTPTMLMTGVKDLRTPIGQTEEFYMALKMLKVPTAMIRFNNEFHGTSRTPSNFIRTQLYLRYWFEKYMTKNE